MSFCYHETLIMAGAAYSMAEVGAQARIICTRSYNSSISHAVRLFDAAFYDRIPGPWRTVGEITFRRFATNRAIPSEFCVHKVFHRVNGVEALLAESDPYRDPRDAIQNLSEKVFYDNRSLLFPS